MLVGTERGLLEVDDGSARRALDGRVHALGADGRWAIVDGGLVQRTSADLWQARVTFEPPGSVQLTSLTPVGEGVLVGAGGHLIRYRVTGDSPHMVPVPGFDAVEGREEWHAVGSAEPYVRSITATADGVLLANVHVGGIPRSTDGGETWHPTIDVDTDVHEVRAHPQRPDLVLAAAAVGLCVSRDGGATWTVLGEGLHGTYCRAVAFAADAALVSASTGPFTTQAAVYRWPLDGTASFERVTQWQPHNVDTGCLDALGDVAVFGGPDGVVHRSEDGGRSWAVLVDRLAAITAVSAR